MSMMRTLFLYFVTGFFSLAFADSAVWIDVRSPQEFQGEHVSNAINLPYDSISQTITKHVPNKDTPLNLYCRSGRRSEIATQTLISMGYTQVTNLGGLEDALEQEAKVQNSP